MTYVEQQAGDNKIKHNLTLHRVKDLYCNTAELNRGSVLSIFHARRDWDLQQKEKTNVFLVALARNITIDVRMMCTIKTNDVYFSARCRQEGELVYKFEPHVC